MRTLVLINVFQYSFFFLIKASIIITFFNYSFIEISELNI